jgi:hypothetical protein
LPLSGIFGEGAVRTALDCVLVADIYTVGMLRFAGEKELQRAVEIVERRLYLLFSLLVETLNLGQLDGL